jgi:hypothetical protein
MVAATHLVLVASCVLHLIGLLVYCLLLFSFLTGGCLCGWTVGMGFGLYFQDCVKDLIGEDCVVVVVVVVRSCLFMDIESLYGV